MWRRRTLFQSISRSLTKFLVPALCLLGTTASAGTLTLTGVDRTRGGFTTVVEDGESFTGYAGVLLGTYNGTTVSPLFCVDLFTSIDLGDSGSSPLAPSLARHEDRVAWLYLNQLGTVTTSNRGLAFQIAIWDIVHDGGDGLGSGTIQSCSSQIFPDLTPTQMTLINNYLTVSAGQSATGGVSIYHNVNLSTGDPAQNLIGAFSAAELNPVPEPATFGLMALGAAGLLVVRRWRKAQS